MRGVRAFEAQPTSTKRYARAMGILNAKEGRMANHSPIDTTMATVGILAAYPKDATYDSVNLGEDGFVENNGHEQMCRHCTKNAPDERKPVAER